MMGLKPQHAMRYNIVGAHSLSQVVILWQVPRIDSSNRCEPARSRLLLLFKTRCQRSSEQHSTVFFTESLIMGERAYEGW